MSKAIKPGRGAGSPVIVRTHYRKSGVIILGQRKGVCSGGRIEMRVDEMKTQIPTEDGITMQDIRLIAGEGKLTEKTIQQAIAVIRKQRGDKK